MEFMLAPMEKLTDACFRAICYKYGADLTFTEFVRFEALARNNKASYRRIELHDDTPTVIQLIGSAEDDLKKFLHYFEPNKGFRGFNFNLGCPSENYNRDGVACAMIRRPAKTNRLVKIVEDHGYSASIKMRLGYNQEEKEQKVYLRLIENVDADYFIVHARHRKEKYRKPADWSVFEDCVATGKQIVANGDIRTKKHVEFFEEIGVMGVMIGRAAVKNPRIFAEMKGIPAPPVDEIRKEYKELCRLWDIRYPEGRIKTILQARTPRQPGRIKLESP